MILDSGLSVVGLLMTDVCWGASGVEMRWSIFCHLSIHHPRMGLAVEEEEVQRQQEEEEWTAPVGRAFRGSSFRRRSCTSWGVYRRNIPHRSDQASGRSLRHQQRDLSQVTLTSFYLWSLLCALLCFTCVYLFFTWLYLISSDYLSWPDSQPLLTWCYLVWYTAFESSISRNNRSLSEITSFLALSDSCVSVPVRGS